MWKILLFIVWFESTPQIVLINFFLSAFYYSVSNTEGQYFNILRIKYIATSIFIFRLLVNSYISNLYFCVIFFVHIKCSFVSAVNMKIDPNDNKAESSSDSKLTDDQISVGGSATKSNSNSGLNQTADHKLPTESVKEETCASAAE